MYNSKDVIIVIRFNAQNYKKSSGLDKIPTPRGNNMSTKFQIIAKLGEELEKTKRRNVMVDLVAQVLIKLHPDEIKPATAMILGYPFSEREAKTLEISWSTVSSALMSLVNVDWKTIEQNFGETGDLGSTVKNVLEKNKIERQTTLVQKSLSILDVKKIFETLAQIKGSGSKKQKIQILKILLGNATPLEAKYLGKILIKEMRTGLQKGLMAQAISKAFKITEDEIRKADMIIGDITEVAKIAKTQGKKGIIRVKIEIFRPIKPMLARTVQTVEEALNEHNGKTAFEYKLDGARVQIHISKKGVKIFSRRLLEISSSFPDIINLILKTTETKEAILDGEIIAIGKGKNPLPFQHLMRRFRRIYNIKKQIEKIPVKLVLFDLLYYDRKSLINQPYSCRRKKLKKVINRKFIVKQKIISNPIESKAFLKEAIQKGHEGLIAKKINSKYTPGIRGKSWFKIKTTLEPLDLLIVAAEYGYGRRHNWLSNYYLAAQNQETREFFIVGKTFKGLTDDEMIEMTKQLKKLTIKTMGRRVIVQPKIVVEVAYNEIQESSKYKSKLALRFARIIRVRKEKTPQEVDTIKKIEDIYQQQFTKKARYINKTS